jgi:hypothetical protein
MTFSDSTRSRGAPAAACLILLSLATSGCARRASLTVPLKFRPTSQLKMAAFAGEIPDASVYVGAVNDVRVKNDRIGENLEEDKPVPVFAGGVEPAEFVRSTLRDLLSRAGLPLMADPGGAERVLVSDLHYFWTQETSTYETEVRLTLTVRDRAGRQLWKGTVNGTAERFGRSLKAENYQEVFSDAMVDLVQSLLGNQSFRDALKRGAKPAAGP